jgi:3-deoxy-D-manno-octulosonate 8-phosphate phosphatase (KDO 8-P phosphatase)
MTSYKTILPGITTFVFDYDGVLTDGTVFISRHGELLRTANVKDGYALAQAVKHGYNIAVITGGRTTSLQRRFEALNIHDVFIGVDNKLEVFMEYIRAKGIQPAHVLYMGDDLLDYDVMKIAGLAACPADAAPEIKAISGYISHHKGGMGCARDVIEQVMRIQGKWFVPH